MRNSERGTTRAGTSTPKSERTRKRILDATAAVMTSRGYIGLRISEIAEIAGVGQPTIYHYYATRDDLAEVVALDGLRRVIDHVASAVAELPEGAAAIDRICAAAKAHLEVAMGESAYASAAIRSLGQLPDHLADVQKTEMRRYAALWDELLRQGMESNEIRPGIDPYSGRLLIIGALNWACQWANPARTNTDTIFRTIETMLTQGLSAR